MEKIVWKSSEICTFLKILNFNFPHIMLSSTAGKICLSCCLKENFNTENFSFSFENLCIFEDLWRFANSSKIFVFVLGLFSETEESSYLSPVHFQSSLQDCYEAFLRKSEESRPPKIGHFRGGLLSSLLAKNPSTWLYDENFFTLVTIKVHFEPLRGFFGQKWRKQT